MLLLREGECILAVAVILIISCNHAMAGGVSLAGVLQLTGVYPLMRSLQSIISLDTSERSFGVETLDGALRAGF